MKHLERTLATYVYNHCNKCNITIYFCNIHIKHLQHTSETIEIYTYNIRFQCNISLLLGGIEPRWCVVFTGGSGPAALVGGGPAVVAARLGEDSSAPRLAGPTAERRDSEAAARRA
jgi:hypothetical protein